jgi:hypothetical protein
LAAKSRAERLEKLVTKEAHLISQTRRVWLLERLMALRNKAK